MLSILGPGSHDEHEHIIDITRDRVGSASDLHGRNNNELEESDYDDRSSTIVRAHNGQPPSASDSRNASSGRRRDSHRLQRGSPLNSGCVASLPHLYWRYIHRNTPGLTQESAHLHQSSQVITTAPTPYTIMSVNQVLEGEHLHRTGAVLHIRQNLVIASPRLNAAVGHFKMALDCFFAVWFVVGNVWVFGGHSSASASPNLYRLCIVFLTFSCIGYAMPFIMCAAICCCLPCIISILGLREEFNQTRGATTDMICSLPTYKFKLKVNQNGPENEPSLEDTYEGGILGVGTDRERIVSAEDCICCICLAKYKDNDDLRELPCTHFLHKECVDKWLKINALCPLCKSAIW
ncbi:Zinc finger RING/FYVE/PHD-type protein [Dioscorea alata]|uniref:Zinc finger RING/FYVE/PHD-type protein n=1 Tax=Dioscorea alata TaxID=55571 RepID=A0ACB7TSR9_DIOAL|nr:Zinc finger RING/FYVE/PHD-type protein [Dioscorea alata]